MIACIIRDRRPALVGACLLSTAAAVGWMGHGDRPGSFALLLVLEALPMAALLFAGDDIPWWLAIAAVVGFAAFTAASVQSVLDSTSSTAAIVLPLIPVVLVAAVAAMVAACDVVEIVRLHVSGVRIARPRRGELVLAAALAAAGFLALFVFGLIAGLLVAFVVWAHRARVEARPA